jgi:hypothetical protein
VSDGLGIVTRGLMRLSSVAEEGSQRGTAAAGPAVEMLID